MFTMRKKELNVNTNEVHQSLLQKPSLKKALEKRTKNQDNVVCEK